MRVIVVGAGIMGLSCAWGLSRQGHQVQVLEQASVPNPYGSSVDQHRLIRYPYGGEDGYCRMIPAALNAWEQLWEYLGERLYVPTGALVLSDGTPNDWAAQSAASLERCGIPFETVDAAALQRDYPQLVPLDFAWGFCQREGGVLLAEAIIAALAQRLGDRVCPQQRVVAVDPVNATLTIAGGKHLSADALIISAGPWSGQLLPDLAPRLSPSRQLVVYIDPPEIWRSSWQHSPAIVAMGAEGGFYLVPPVAGTGLKVGDHTFSLIGSPDDDREPQPDEIQALLKQTLPQLRDGDQYRLQSARRCFYTVTANERFIVERRERAWILAGFSGHGFKFGPLLGLRLAAALSDGVDATDLSRWAAGLAAA